MSWDPGASRPQITVMALGGAGEFGRNATLVVAGPLHDGPCLLIDCGARVASATVPGADLLLPDLAFIEQLGARLLGYVLTHGHEDHIAALPFALQRCPAPVHAPAYVLAQLAARLAARGLDHLPQRALIPGQPQQIGPFTVETLAVAHSIPDAAALSVRVAGALLVFSGDFRVDAQPVAGAATDLAALRALGDQGVTALVADSTGALTPGDNPGERVVHQALHDAVDGAAGRAVVTTFTSHIHRLQQLFEIAEATGRRVALAGRSATTNVELARRAGLLTPPPGLLVDMAAAIDLLPARLLLVATGCQGEPRSALARMARGAAELPPVQPGDRVVFSARVIPGNELAVLQLADQLVRRGAQVLMGAPQIHVSGHGFQGDLAQLLRCVRPQILIPVHGNRLHLQAHADLAERLGLTRDRIAVVDNGQPVELGAVDGTWRFRGGVPVELSTHLLEQDRVFAIDGAVLAARHNAARRGVLGVAVPLREGRARPCRLGTSGVDTRAVGALLVEAQAEVDRDLARLDAETLREAAGVEQAVVAAVRRAFQRRGVRPPQIVVLPVPT